METKKIPQFMTFNNPNYDKSSKNRKQKIVKKCCSYDNCGVEYFGLKVSKYCEKHKLYKNRIIIPKKYDQGVKKIKKGSKVVETLELKCELKGCNNYYKIMYNPLLFKYPKYCELHRNEYRRYLFTKLGGFDED